MIYVYRTFFSNAVNINMDYFLNAVVNMPRKFTNGTFKMPTTITDMRNDTCNMSKNTPSISCNLHILLVGQTTNTQPTALLVGRTSNTYEK